MKPLDSSGAADSLCPDVSHLGRVVAGVGAGDYIQTRDVPHPGKDVRGGGGGAAGIRRTWQVKGEYAVEGGGEGACCRGLSPWLKW